MSELHSTSYDLPFESVTGPFTQVTVGELGDDELDETKLLDDDPAEDIVEEVVELDNDVGVEAGLSTDCRTAALVPGLLGSP